MARTGNGPVGDDAAALFTHAFGRTLEPNLAAGHDATDAVGTRCQVEARREGRSPGAGQLGAIRHLAERDFDWLAAIFFDPRVRVRRALLVPYDVARASATRVEHTESWRPMLSDRLCGTAEVRDVTDALVGAQSTLPDRPGGGVVAELG